MSGAKDRITRFLDMLHSLLTICDIWRRMEGVGWGFEQSIIGLIRGIRVTAHCCIAMTTLIGQALH